ncbi:MAG: aminotransferase class I/II-fold pyridoxal phosphate-dependent enzyme [Pirellulaceae bacterium]
MRANADLLRFPSADLAEPSSNGTNGHSHGCMDELCNRMRNDKFIRLGLEFLERIGYADMKDLTLTSVINQRHCVIEEREVVNFGSAGFLGLDFHSRLRDAITDSINEWGTHQSCSRIFYSTGIYQRIESRLASWLDVEDTLVFPSVSLCHSGVIPALAGRGDVLVVDRTSHNSIWMACKIASANGAELRSFDASNPKSLDGLCQRDKRNGCLVLVDGVYSMSGEIPQLAELYEAAKRNGAVLYVDDAHGTGVVGPGGRGSTMQALGTLRDVLHVGSLSKGFSTMGAYITCPSALKMMVKMKAGTYIFSGPIPAPYLAAIDAVLDLIETDEFEEIRRRLHQRIRQMTDGLDQLDLSYRGGVGPIISILVGEIEQTLKTGVRLFEKGYYVQSVTYPAVPINGGILRVQINANHTPEAIDGLLRAIGEVRDELTFAKA